MLSGFSPIRNQSGAVVGLVGVDINSDTEAAAINHLNLLITTVGLFAVLATALGLLVIDHRRAIDEKRVEESERKYRALFERAGDAIFLVDADSAVPGKIVAANKSAAEMHGYTQEELETMTMAHLDAPGAEVTTPETVNRVLFSGWMKGERMHRRKDGTHFPVEFSASPLEIGGRTYILVIDRNITDRKKAVDAIQRTTNKLNLLNTVTFSDIQNAIYGIAGCIELDGDGRDETSKMYWEMERDLIRKIRRSLNFAKNYQDLGTIPPKWQNVGQVFLFAISHIDFSSIRRTVEVEGLEVYADSLLERVFQALADNVITKGKTATKVSLSWKETPAGLTIIFEDNGVGIPENLKEAVFQRGFGTQKAMELFLVREILGITGITIRETGIPGAGARFESSSLPADTGSADPDGGSCFPDTLSFPVRHDGGLQNIKEAREEHM